MNKTSKKILSGAMSSAMLLAGAADAVMAETAVAEGTQVEYQKVANVTGVFSFNQNEMTPADDVFNIFGTAVTGICAKPDFAMSSVDKDYYVNVGGKIAYSHTFRLRDLAKQSRTMLCACATGPATAQAQVTGVNVSDVLELAKLDKNANTLLVKSADGYTAKLPLKYVLEKEAMLAYQIGNSEIPTGVQLWVPETVAKYFVRNVVELEVTAETEVATLDQRAPELQAEVALKNTVEGKEFEVGKTMTFEGYADDLGEAIASIEFSLDGGETWTTYETAKTVATRWVYWHFGYTPEVAGNYQLSVRAKTVSGKVSPLAANVVFTVK